MTLYHGGNWIEKSPHFEDTDFPNKVSILQTFADSKKIRDERTYLENIFFDSGAFSAFSRGLEVNLQEYIDFLQANKKKITVYAALDVIGDEKGSWNNYKEMRKQGLDPLPAFHYGEDLIWIERYLKYTNYIGLGGIAKSTRRQRRTFLDKVYEKYPNSKKVKFHGYGVTDRELMQRYPWYSVDSTAATIGSCMGRLITQWGSYPFTARKDKQTKFPKNVEITIKDHCKKYDIDFTTLQDDGNPGYVERIKFNVITLEEIFEKRTKIFKTETHYLI